MTKCDVFMNKLSPPATTCDVDQMTAALASASEFLLERPACDAYSEEQTRGCIACVLRLREPCLNDILENLHRLAAPATRRGKSCDASVKALAALLRVRPPIVNSEVVARQLARETGWFRWHRLRALAVLLESAGVEVDELLRLSLRASPHGLAVEALCILTDAHVIGSSQGDSEEAVVLRLGRGWLQTPFHTAGLEILGVLLKCEPSQAKVLSQMGSSGWSSTARDVAKRVAQQSGRVGDATLAGLDYAAVLALRREPRDCQLRGLMHVLGCECTVNDGLREAAIIEALAEHSPDIPGETVGAVLNTVLAAGDAVSAAGIDGAMTERFVEQLVQRIGANGRILTTLQLRVRAFGSLFQTLPTEEALLARVTRCRASGSLQPRISRVVVEFLLLGKVGAPCPRGSSLLASMQKFGLVLENLPAEVLHLVGDAWSTTGTCDASSVPGEQAWGVDHVKFKHDYFHFKLKLSILYSRA
eukprot:TRINITY_DN25353_c0_g2_i2.p1 TRINITY_DN25353_c0_g2~~TRINITY_DN25353_c0_g2_i2.p1  ORF type:complete len:475 (+),score=59.07 TRINITY_DN25353_c0_g2_i2:185-1609(+)